MDVAFDVVVPTAGRPTLIRLLDALAAQATDLSGRVVLVDDRATPTGGLLAAGFPEALRHRLTVVRSGGRGPAAARNRGWRVCRAPWVVFLDDDVLPPPGWARALSSDLDAAERDPAGGVAGSQGRIEVPLPVDRRPTDWERGTAGLQDAAWATADMAVRRSALHGVDGFDERFPRAYREDADLALRLLDAGWVLRRGDRTTVHPILPAPASISVRRQAGNADDALMDRLHGAGWRERAQAPAGRRRRHLLASSGLLIGLAASAGLLATRRGERAPDGRGAARAAGTALAGTGLVTWAGLTTELAVARITPGPRTAPEVATMVWTSAVLPLAASVAWLRGLGRARRLAAAGRPDGTPRPPRLVLLDRDDTLIRDVPYNGDPDLVVPVDGARDALDRLRAAGTRLAVVSNQSGVARGLISPAQVDAVNERVEALVGPIDRWSWCPHGPDDGCTCRKPAPGQLLDTLAAFGVDAEDAVMIGDIGADVEAGQAAGVRAVLVPTDRTFPTEIAAAPEVATGIVGAVDVILGAPVRDVDRSQDPPVPTGIGSDLTADAVDGRRVPEPVR